LVYRLGFLGVYYVIGTISNDGVYLHASGKTDGEIGDGITQAIKDGLNAILASVDNDILNTIIDVLLSIELKSMIFTLDTRSTSTNKKAMLQISMVVSGESIDFSIQIGLDRRRRVLKSPAASLSDKFNDLEPLLGGHRSLTRAALSAESLGRRLQLTEDQLDEMCPEEGNSFSVEDFIDAMTEALDVDRWINLLLGTCPELYSSRGCKDTEFCNLDFQCTSKLGNHEPCLSDNACQSDACAGLCVECNRSSQCSSSEYCLLGNCEGKHGFGHVCAFDDQCASGVCHLLQCTTNSCKNHGPCIFGQELDVCGKTKCCKNEPRVCFPSECVRVCTPGGCVRVCRPCWLGGGCHNQCLPEQCVNECTPPFCVGTGGVDCGDCC